jgi:hypothetical protein
VPAGARAEEAEREARLLRRATRKRVASAAVALEAERAVERDELSVGAKQCVVAGAAGEEPVGAPLERDGSFGVADDSGGRRRVEDERGRGSAGDRGREAENGETEVWQQPPDRRIVVGRRAAVNSAPRTKLRKWSPKR